MEYKCIICLLPTMFGDQTILFKIFRPFNETILLNAPKTVYIHWEIDKRIHLWKRGVLIYAEHSINASNLKHDTLCKQNINNNHNKKVVNLT